MTIHSIEQALERLLVGQFQGDLYVQVGRELLGRDPDPDERRLIKGLAFGKLYR